MKPFKGIIYRDHSDDRVPAYNERFTGYILGWNNTQIPITTSRVIGIQPVREDVCLVETLNSVYLVDLSSQSDDAYDRDLMYQEMDAADLDHDNELDFDKYFPK